MCRIFGACDVFLGGYWDFSDVGSFALSNQRFSIAWIVLKNSSMSKGLVI